MSTKEILILSYFISFVFSFGVAHRDAEVRREMMESECEQMVLGSRARVDCRLSAKAISPVMSGASAGVCGPVFVFVYLGKELQKAL